MARLFCAMLRYWRKRRGYSQLDLALEADVSVRHVSFLESGRSQPSTGMVLRLMAALDVPLAERNAALRAAGLEPHFAEPSLGELNPSIEGALTQMMAQHEPYPLTVLSIDSVILRCNRAATALFSAFVAEPAAMPTPLDMFTLVFDPRLARPYVHHWHELASGMVARLHRENLRRGGDARLQAALERAFSWPGVPREWRTPDFSCPTEPTLTVRLARDERRVAFLVTVTTFQAPQQVMLDELRIESCFPLDDETRRACRELSA